VTVILTVLHAVVHALEVWVNHFAQKHIVFFQEGGCVAERDQFVGAMASGTVNTVYTENSALTHTVDCLHVAVLQASQLSTLALHEVEQLYALLQSLPPFVYVFHHPIHVYLEVLPTTSPARSWGPSSTAT
jgi:hypothetical protein